MAINWITLLDGSGYELKLGVDWKDEAPNGTRGNVTYAPEVWRYDYYYTLNNGGVYTEKLYVDSTAIGTWTLDMPQDDYTYEEYRLDPFNTRTVTRTHSTQTVKLRISWRDFATRDTSYNWHYADDGYHDWTLTVAPKEHYTVSFNVNGGTGAPSSQTKWYNESLTLSSTKPSRSGYTFKGWATTKARADAGTVDKAAGASYTANSAQTYYAVWQINTYTLTYKANGGTGSDVTQTKTYGVSVNVKPANTFTRTSYVFKEWNTNASGTGTAYNAGASYTANSNVTLYAIWYAPYTVSYDASGGSGAPSAQTKVHGSALVLSSTEPTRTNYVFKEWNTAQNGTGTGYNPGGQYTANSSAVLYAQWYAPHTVTYNANGGSGAPAPGVKVYGQSYTVATERPSMSGYNFVEWNTAQDGTGTGYDPGDAYTAEADLVLYAKWVVAHSSPAVSNLVVKRCDSQGDPDDEGTYVLVTADWEVDTSTAGYSDTVIGSITAMLDGVSDSVPFTSGATSGSISYRHSQQISLTSSYPVTVTVTDSKGYFTAKSSTVSVAFFTMNFKRDGDGIAFGKKSTRAGFDVDMDMYAKNLAVSNDFSAVDGSFSGDIDAVNATLSGSLAGTTATFEEVAFEQGASIYEGANGQIYIKSGVNSSNKMAHLAMSPADSTLCVRYSSDGGETWTSWQALANCAATNVFAVGPRTRHSGIDVTQANNGITSNQWPAVATGFDENDVQTSFFGEAIYTDGGVSAGIWSYNYDTSGTQIGTNSISLGVRKDGTKYYNVGDATAFRTAIGAENYFLKRTPASTSDLPQTTTTSTGFPVMLSNSFANTGVISYMTNANFHTWLAGNQADVGWTYIKGSASATDYVRWRKVIGIVYIEAFFNGGTTLTVDTNVSCGTITAGSRPSKEIDVNAYRASNDCGVLWVTTGGAVYVKARGSTSKYLFSILSYPV